MPEPSLRAAVPRDAPRIAAAHVSGWRWTYDAVLPAAYLLDDARLRGRRAQWNELLSSPASRATTQVLDDGAEVLGFVHAGTSRDDPACGEIWAIYLARADLARAGLGRRLMSAGLAHLEAVGFREATLWTLDSNVRARRFYEATGWVEDGARKLEVVADVELPHLRYRTRLRA